MTRKALVVGISTYLYLPKLNLDTFANNAEAIAKKLKDVCNFSEVNRLPDIKSSTTKEPIIVGKKTPVTKEELEQAIVDLFGLNNSRTTTALLYLTGHGFKKTLAEGFADSYLLTSDADLKGNWGLSFSELKRLIQNSRIPEQVVLIDSCNSSEIIDSGDRPINFEDINPGKSQNQEVSRLFLAAATGKAYENRQGKYGILTEALLKGLNPCNYDNRLNINSLSLSSFINEEIQKSRFPQTPVASFFGTPIQLVYSSKTNRLDNHSQQAKEPIKCPYKGLVYFEEKDHPYFYGRNEITDILLDKIRLNNFVALIGASGSGKSSILRAGLLYKLKQGDQLSGSDRWRYYLMNPGDNPLEALAKTFVNPNITSDVCRANELAEAETLISQGAVGLRRLVQMIETNRVVLIIDQFEEVFTLNDKPTREKFFQYLFEALEITEKKLCLIIAMRDDFFSKCLEAEYSGLSKKIQENLLSVTSMTKNELESAIIQPAKQVDLKIEPELIKEIIKDIQNAPSRLPLLQDTLRELWQKDIEQKQDNCLNLKTYIKLGRVTDNLQKRATEVYQEFSLEKQKIVQYIFLSLTQLGEGTEDTCRRVLKQELIRNFEIANKVAMIEEVIVTLADKKLIVTYNEDTTNEGLGKEVSLVVAHETLIRHWNELRQWLDEKRDCIKQERKLNPIAQDWLKSGKKEDYLLKGYRLAEAKGYFQNSAHSKLWLNQHQLTKEFLQASSESEERIREEEKCIQKEKDKTILFLKTSIAIICGFVILITYSGISSYKKSQIAQLREKAIKVKSELSTSNETERLANSIKLVGENQKINNNLILRLINGFRSEADIFPEVHSALYKAIDVSRERFFFEKIYSETISSIAFSSNGEYIVIADEEDKNIKIWKVDHKESSSTIKYKKIKRNNNDSNFSIKSIAISDDGDYIAISYGEGTLELWDVNNDQSSLRYKSLPNQVKVNFLAFSPNGNYIVSGSDEGIVNLWDKKDSDPIYTFDYYKESVKSVVFRCDKKNIIIGYQNGRIISTDTIDNNKKPRFISGNEFKPDQDKPPINSLASLAVSCNGNQIIGGYENGIVRLWDLDTKDLLHTFIGHNESINSVEFSNDGNLIVTAYNEGTVQLWHKNNTLLHTFEGNENLVRSLSFNSTEKYIVVADYGGNVRYLDVENKNILDTFESKVHGNDSLNIVFYVASSPRENYIIAAYSDGIKLFKIKEDNIEHLHSYETDNKINSVAFSHDGKYIVSGDTQGEVQLLKIEKEKLEFLDSFNLDDSTVNSLAFSYKDEYIVSSTPEKTQLLKLEEEQLIDIDSSDKPKFNSITVNLKHNKDIIVGGSLNNKLELWEIKKNKLIYLDSYSQNKKKAINSVAFSNDGKYIVSGNNDGIMQVWTLNPYRKITKDQDRTFSENKKKAINSVAFSNDGKYIISGGANGTVQLWDIERKIILHNFKSYEKLANKSQQIENRINSVAFSHDGKYIVSGDHLGTIKLWQGTDWQNLLLILCDKIETRHNMSRHTKTKIDISEFEEICSKEG